MAKYTSGRQKNLRVGILSYSENTQVLSVIGRVGIGSTTFNADYDLDVRGTTKLFGNIILGNTSSNLINVPGRISSNLYPDGDGTYDVGRAPQIGSGANRWKDANFIGKGTFDAGVDAHDLELGVSSANLIYSTSGNLELNSQSGTTNIDDIVTISGNTGIGTANPTSKLWVNGDAYFSGILTANRIFSNIYGEFTGGSISGTNIVGAALSISGISTFTNGPVLIGGNLGIGITNPTSKLHVVGDTYITGVVTATDINSASDIRLKTNIKPFENTLEKIVHINGVSFNWIENNAKSGGIIAQDLEKVFPELVNDGDHKTVNYNGLIGVLIEAIKELKSEVDDLKQRLNDL
jgi:hypothetical protein